MGIIPDEKAIEILKKFISELEEINTYFEMSEKPLLKDFINGNYFPDNSFFIKNNQIEQSPGKMKVINFDDLKEKAGQGDFIFFRINEEFSKEFNKKLAWDFMKLNYKNCKILLLNEDTQNTGRKYEGYHKYSIQDKEIKKLFRGRREPAIFTNYKI